jgi:hypothetical protein
VKTNIPDGSFVMDATTTSLLGDGNTESGAHQLAELEEKAQKAGYFKNYPRSGNVKVHLSDGEYVLSPETVSFLGGANAASKLRKNIRKHKGVTKILPPKSKPLHSYLR